MFGNYTLITAAFVLPLFGVYFFLLTRLVSSTSDEQRRYISEPPWTIGERFAGQGAARA